MSSLVLQNRLVRYADLRPCLNAFVDTRTPGSDRKENFTIIGPGVSENPDQYVHIPEAHGFNIGGARQPPGCLNSQHSHDTAEVFVVHSGRWRFLFGVNADDDSVELAAGDTISIPTKMFRGFENIGTEAGFLFAVLGGDDPGKVIWAPSVFTLAEQYGLALLEGGRLVDLAAGDQIPEGVSKQMPPSSEQLAQLQTPAPELMQSCVAFGSELKSNADSSLLSLASEGGVEEAGVITPGVTEDGFQPGPIEGWWPHGFNLRRLSMATGASIAAHTRQEAEVVFVQSGSLTLKAADSDVVHMHPGDTITLPVGLERSWHNPGTETLVAFAVRGGDSPAMPLATNSL